MHQVQGFFAVSTDMSCRSRHSCVNRPVKANVLYAWLKDFLLAFTATKTKLLAKTLRSEAHTYKYVLHISDKQRELFVYATCHELVALCSRLACFHMQQSEPLFAFSFFLQQHGPPLPRFGCAG